MDALTSTSYESQLLPALAKLPSLTGNTTAISLSFVGPGSSSRFNINAWLVSTRQTISFKSNVSHPTKTHNALLDDAQWWEELTALDMAKFQLQDRPELWALSSGYCSG